MATEKVRQQIFPLLFFCFFFLADDVLFVVIIHRVVAAKVVKSGSADLQVKTFRIWRWILLSSCIEIKCRPQICVKIEVKRLNVDFQRVSQNVVK